MTDAAYLSWSEEAIDTLRRHRDELLRLAELDTGSGIHELTYKAMQAMGAFETVAALADDKDWLLAVCQKADIDPQRTAAMVASIRQRITKHIVQKFEWPQWGIIRVTFLYHLRQRKTFMRGAVALGTVVAVLLSALIIYPRLQKQPIHVKPVMIQISSVANFGTISVNGKTMLYQGADTHYRLDQPKHRCSSRLCATSQHH